MSRELGIWPMAEEMSGSTGYEGAGQSVVGERTISHVNKQRSGGRGSGLGRAECFGMNPHSSDEGSSHVTRRDACGS